MDSFNQESKSSQSQINDVDDDELENADEMQRRWAERIIIGHVISWQEEWNHMLALEKCLSPWMRVQLQRHKWNSAGTSQPTIIYLRDVSPK